MSCYYAIIFNKRRTMEEVPLVRVSR